MFNSDEFKSLMKKEYINELKKIRNSKSEFLDEFRE